MKLQKKYFTYRSLCCLILVLMTINIELGMTLSVADPLILLLSILNLKKLTHGIDIPKWKRSMINVLFFFFFSAILLLIFSYSNYIFAPYKPGITVFLKIFFAFIYGINFIFFFSLAIEEDLLMYLKYTTIGATVVSVTCIIGVSLAQVGIYTSWVQYGTRGTGVMHDPNITAIFLTIQMFLMLLYYQCTKKKWAITSFLLALMAIGTTGSKGALLVLVMLFFVSIILLAITGKVVRLLKFTVYLLIAGFFLFIVVQHTTIFATLVDRVSMMSSSNLSSTTTGRSDLWLYALHLIEVPKNFFFGVGLGAFYKESLREGVLLLNTLVHNTFLSIFVETGFLSFLLWIAFFTYPTFFFFKKYLNYRNIVYLYLFLSSLAMLVGMNQVNYQNNRSLYIVIVFYYFVIAKEKGR